MEELINKLSSYELFNNLLPGIVFSFMLSKILNIDIIGDIQLIERFLMYYFVGLLIGRIGSLIIEPLAKKVRIIRRAAYKDYLEAEKNDPKIKILSDVNILYRNIVTTFGLLLAIIEIRFLFWNNSMENLLKVKLYFMNNFPVNLLLILLILFILSYRKQTQYIKGRIDGLLKRNNGG